MPLELAKAITSHRSLPDLFRELACRMHHVFGLNHFAVWLHDGARNVMRLHTLETCGPSSQQVLEEVPIEGSIPGWVWQNQQPFISRNLEQETRFPITKMLPGHRAKSVCSLPLTTAHRRLGVLSIASDQAGAYDQLDLEFAQLIAAQIAVAVDNVFNFQEAQSYQQQLTRERDRLRLLLDVNNVVVSTLDLHELLGAISTSLRQALRHDYASLALYDPESKQLRLQALEFSEGDGLMQEGIPVPLEGTPAGLAFTSRQPVLVNRLSFEHFPSEITRRLLGDGLKSGCCVPLISPGRVSGVLNVASLRENAFTQADADLLGEVAKQVAIAVENALSFHQIVELQNKLADEKLYLEDEIRTAYNFEEIVGVSPALRRALQEVETVAPTDSTVLIYGETGTGKELIARAIHNLSPRRERTLVKVNCASIPTGLLESEMFGHEKGAFTGAIERRAGRFELAHRGTIFLDEVEDIPLELQPKLLRVLQEQEFERLGSSRTTRVDVRVVAATNTDLAQMVGEKKFRSDLYYRLNVFPITLPPLRERPEDIPLLVHFFAHKFAQQMKRPIERIPTETMAALTSYAWPGNIRELQNLIERAVILSRGSVLEIPLAELKQAARLATEQLPAATLEAVERAHILRVLEEANWVIGGPTGAAARLGLKRTTLNNKMRKLGITRPQ
ncbi:MAG TPA: sigma 54-interacting transcriptional regulator [Blastocatellia bacterium]|nr:sigma 54-interacting transcriptional regulator [Blastocatellia bacterium]